MIKQPHIVLFTVDQQRGDTLGCMGHPCVRTPHLDVMMRQGVIFDNAYTDCPVCIPARTTMITGIQSQHYGKPDFCPEFRIERKREQFLGSIMNAAGYQTGLIGKSHWHTEPSFRAGFESWTHLKRWEQDIVQQTGCRHGFHGIGANELSPTLSNIPPHLHQTHWSIDRAIEFIEDRDQTQPLFLWISIEAPHPPNVIHEPYYSMYDDEDIPEPAASAWSEKDEDLPLSLRHIRYGNAHEHMKEKEKRKARGVYYGMITHIDHQIGRLIGALTANKLWEDTFFIYNSDHGECLGDHGTFFKGNFLEGAAHIPFLVRPPQWLGIRTDTRKDCLIEHSDLLPTLCDLAGTLPPEDIDGHSLLPILQDKQNSVRKTFHGQIGEQHIFHNGRYKYLYFAADGKELLFDKSSDPLDEKNLAGKQDLVDPIRKEFIAHLEQENNPHIREGKLVNLKQKLPESEIGCGLGWRGLVSSLKK